MAAPAGAFQKAGFVSPSQRQAELVRAMLEPGLYPDAPDRVELRETHGSWVFLVGDLAYKVKKGVTLPFLDYGTLERRHELCREEVRLNRRLAPGYYLGVEAVTRAADGFRLAPEDDRGAVEYVVKMRRVPEERTVERLAERGRLDRDRVDAVARRLASFHAEAEAAAPEAREVDRLLEPLEENIETLLELGPPLIARDRLLSAERFTAEFIAARRGQLAARARSGLVRDCHGDLRGEHIFFEDGEVQAYDCIEFNPALRWIDVSADLAFLVMDLFRLGASGEAERLVETYRRAGGDPGDDSLLFFYASFRAWVSAKVARVRARELSPGAQLARQEENARRAFALGHRLAWRARLPLVIAVCGVAASGKTTLASRLSEISALPHLSSDLTRKRIVGVSPDERASPEHYSEEVSLRTYEELGRSAAAALERDGGAIVDATFRRASDRRAFTDALGEPAESMLLARCQAPAALLRERAVGRDPASAGASDAGPDVVAQQLSEFAPLDEVPAGRRTTIDAAASIGEQVLEVEELANLALSRERP